MTTLPEEYGEYTREAPEEPVQAPPPYSLPQQWSWSTDKILWAAGAVLALGFGIYFLMSFSSAKARAIAEAVSGDADGN